MSTSTEFCIAPALLVWSINIPVDGGVGLLDVVVVTLGFPNVIGNLVTLIVPAHVDAGPVYLSRRPMEPKRIVVALFGLTDTFPGAVVQTLIGKPVDVNRAGGHPKPLTALVLDEGTTIPSTLPAVLPLIKRGEGNHGTKYKFQFIPPLPQDMVLVVQ